ncbi:hypothetical protein KGO95_00080 [Patescibacteria group bacterium]|nr:hypothetical protein [Patescibacteria group bacterium]
MILATHAIIGGAIGKFFPNDPILAFTLGFASHFVADAIPHWHYPLFSAKIDRNDPMKNDMLINKWFIVDLFNIGVDCLLGIIVAVVFLHPQAAIDSSLISILAGALGAVVPDALQFVFWKLPDRVLRALQRFHLWIHSKTDIDAYHLSGIAMQAAIAALAIMLANAFVH